MVAIKSDAFTNAAITDNVIKYRLPTGIPGDITRSEHAVVEPNMYAPTNYPTAFGYPIKLVSGLVTKVTGSEAATDLYGWLVRPYPYGGVAQAPTRGTSTPDTTQAADVLRRGYIYAYIAEGTPAKGNICYVRVTVNGTLAVGNLSDVSDSAKCVACGYFMGAADANGIAEVAVGLHTL